MISTEKIQQYEELDLMSGLGLPVSEKSKNRLYLHWRNQKDVQCKMIGPETKCFCNHRFKEHQYLNVNPNNGKKVACKAPKCKCKCYEYIPAHGANDFKCLCKHSYKQHNLVTKKCLRDKCPNNCTGFSSAWTCSCGSKYPEHITIIQSYQQRKQKNKPINDLLRLNNELNNAIQEGSLYKPVHNSSTNTNSIKQDPQARVKQKRESLGINNVGSGLGAYGGYEEKGKTIHYEEEELEEYRLVPRINKAKR